MRSTHYVSSVNPYLRECRFARNLFTPMHIKLYMSLIWMSLHPPSTASPEIAVEAEAQVISFPVQTDVADQRKNYDYTNLHKIPDIPQMSRCGIVVGPAALLNSQLL